MFCKTEVSDLMGHWGHMVLLGQWGARRQKGKPSEELAGNDAGSAGRSLVRKSQGILAKKYQFCPPGGFDYGWVPCHFCKILLAGR